MNFVNLTPHEVTIVDENGNTVLVVTPEKTPARVEENVEKIGEVDGIPVTTVKYGDIINLPEPKMDTVYIVSSLVAQRATDRQDVFIPGQTVRNKKGQPIGCQSLARV